jgi:uncharacterized protein YndB with AHSA1/START domain
VVAAGAERTFRALVDPGDLAGWLAPEGMTGRFEHFDMRTGGSYRLVLAYDDPVANPGKAGDGSDVVDGRIVEVVEGDRVVHAADFVSDDPSMAGTMTMTFSVTPVDNSAAPSTRVDVVADDVPDGISAADHAEGMGSSLAKLAAIVER